MESSPSDPENVDRIQDSFSRSPSITHQYQRIDPKKSGYRQANLVEGIVSRLYVEFQHQANMVNSDPHKDPAPPIAGTAEILQQVIY